jgi:EmrB/QacA subfamily drug resistance transporter
MPAVTQPRNPWPALVVLCIANFLILLDTTIVNTAAPQIMGDLGAGIDEILWVLNAYLLAFASLLILFGRLGDLVGPRRLFLVGLVVFTVASFLCGVSAGPGQLIAARVLQGIGAAILVPLALAFITLLFSPDRRGPAFGIFSAVAGIAAVSGPTIGGFLIDRWGWQSIFFLNVPVGLIGLVLAARLLPDLRGGREHRFDLPGVVLATSALCALIYGLVEGPRHHWGAVAGPVSIPAVLILSAVLMVAFVLVEQRQPEPLVPAALVRNRNFVIATLVTLVIAVAMYGLLLAYVIETETGLGMSALKAGVVALPWTVVMSATAPVAGRLADRVGGRLLLSGGLATFAVGALGVAYLPSATSGGLAYAGPLVLVGLGIGATIAPATTEAMRPVAADLSGAASGLLNTARQVGGALGAAVVGAVLQNRLVHTAQAAAADHAGQLAAPLREPFRAGFRETAARGLQLGAGQSGGVSTPTGLSGGDAAHFTALVHQAFAEALVAASRTAFTVTAVVGLLGAVLALGMTGGRPTRLRPEPGSEPELRETTTTVLGER